MANETREDILAAIKRTALANEGVPLGQERFTKLTGIPKSAWHGRYWRKWSEALVEAGYEPNTFTGPTDTEKLIELYAGLIRELRRMPTEAEIKLRRRHDPSFPAPWVIAGRLGPRSVRIQKVFKFCEERGDLGDVREICQNALLHMESSEYEHDDVASIIGYVYLAKSGGHYKIGRTDDLARRKKELTILLPEGLQTVHVIRTDDPAGIEAYWHRRFADRRGNGEWFRLTVEDVKAFKRRKFM